MGVDELAHDFGLVGRVTIDDQKDLVILTLDQTPEEVPEHVGINACIGGHEPEMALGFTAEIMFIE